MSIELLTALSLFALVSSITPGPNNMMLLASGANYGLLRTLPHMLGVTLGFSLMVALVGLGIIQLFDLFPWSYTLLQTVAVLYLLYLAYCIGSATGAPEASRGGSKPMTFIQAVLFQWVNPKAWTMALTAISVYAPERSVGAVLLVALVFGLVNLPSVSLWAVLGQQLQRWLGSPKRLRLFNVSMALLLVLSLWPMLT
ncbi:LysE family translocator [uncultured Ferrimonas sp.]|uniref:LysE family translocator n=1 Tax=uncultured Ferrimonas sp. TaxID=432640 RepID=UPI00260A12B6|nr:LysE family translocator [uncultured Ferrimonas sp.]